MALTAKHPLYGKFLPDWTTMQATYDGERHVKHAASLYLPPTRTMIADGMSVNGTGWNDYQAYKTRAVFHEIVQPAVDAMLGVMHRKPMTIELPDSMWDKSTDKTNRKSVVMSFNGEDLDVVLQNINRAQLITGRLGLLVDVATGAKPGDAPYLIQYAPESIGNWDSTKPFADTGLRKPLFVVLDESGLERKAGLQWETQKRYRVLANASLVDGATFPGIDKAEGVGSTAYVAGEALDDESEGALKWVRPSLAGTGLDEIPFTFINAVDLCAEPAKPPLLGLAQMALAIYRGEADYRNFLFYAAQATLVTIGEKSDPEQAKRIGPNARIALEIGGDAKYVGAGSDLIEPMRHSIQDDKQQAAQLGATMLDQKGNDAESAAALGIRSAARTCSLTNIAKAGAAGLEIALKQAATLMGADPTKVRVQPNLEFESDSAVALDAVNLQTGKNMGLPISTRSVHGWLARNDFTSLSYDEEMAEMENDPPPLAPLGTPGVAGVPGVSGQKPGATAQGAPKPAAKTPVAKPAAKG